MNTSNKNSDDSLDRINKEIYNVPDYDSIQSPSSKDDILKELKVNNDILRGLSEKMDTIISLLSQHSK